MEWYKDLSNSPGIRGQNWSDIVEVFPQVDFLYYILKQGVFAPVVIVGPITS